MSDLKGAKNKERMALAIWIRTEDGRMALLGAIRRSQKETTYLKKIRAVDPKKLEEVITH